MNRILIAFFLGMMSALLGCPSPSPINPVQDADASGFDASFDSSFDAAPDPFGNYTCGSWCAHAKDMRCLAALPTEHGASCLDVCSNMQNGVVPFDLKCRSLASSCEAADACESPSTRARVVFDAGVDASVDDVSALRPTCANWCAHAQKLGCASAKATGGGAPCTDVCSNIQTGPAAVRFNLGCRIAAKTCTAADACERHR